MLVSPSLLAADFGNLEREMTWFNASDADLLHLDLMDGIFVPNLSFGFPVLEAVARLCTKPLDAHLMVQRPQDYLPRMLKLPNLRYFNFHVESDCDVTDLLGQVRKSGLPCALTISPDTPVAALRPWLNVLDMVLIMSVYPGFGGQKFIPATLSRVRELKAMAKEAGKEILIEVDGGVNHETSPQLALAGTDILVAGSYVFGSADPAGRVSELKAL